MHLFVHNRNLRNLHTHLHKKNVEEGRQRKLFFVISSVFLRINSSICTLCGCLWWFFLNSDITEAIVIPQRGCATALLCTMGQLVEITQSPPMIWPNFVLQGARRTPAKTVDCCFVVLIFFVQDTFEPLKEILLFFCWHLNSSRKCVLTKLLDLIWCLFVCHGNMLFFS